MSVYQNPIDHNPLGSKMGLWSKSPQQKWQDGHNPLGKNGSVVRIASMGCQNYLNNLGPNHGSSYDTSTGCFQESGLNSDLNKLVVRTCFEQK